MNIVLFYCCKLLIFEIDLFQAVTVVGMVLPRQDILNCTTAFQDEIYCVCMNSYCSYDLFEN